MGRKRTVIVSPEIREAVNAYTYAKKHKLEITEKMRWGNREYAKAKYRADPWGRKLSNLRTKAKKLGVPFDLTKADVADVKECPVFGWDLVFFNEGGPVDASCSVDRIDPGRGYTKDNVVVVSNLVNSIKQDATSNEILSVASFFSEAEKNGLLTLLKDAPPAELSHKELARFRYKVTDRIRAQSLKGSFNSSGVVFLGRCPVLGTHLHYSGGGPFPNTATMVLLHKTEGLQKGNVVIVSNKAMRIRHTATPEQIRAVGSWLAGIEKAVALKEVT